MGSVITPISDRVRVCHVRWCNARTGPDRLLRDTQSTAADHRPLAMTKLLGFVGATVGGYAGWALGALAGPFTAFMVSMIGTGVGMYYGRRIAQNIGA